MEENKNTQVPETEQTLENQAAAPETQAPQEEAPEAAPQEAAEALESVKAQLAAEHDAHLRLAAEYDNFRKRTQKEHDALYKDAKADTIAKFLPVYDNLLRAMEQPSTDEAFKKGVEMTMTGFMAVLEGLGVTTFGQVGEAFDPNFHNAVMHRDDEAFGESVICEVFQTGFKTQDKVIRHAMVVVAN